VIKSVLDTSRAGGKARDEIFVDIVEKVSCTFSSSGYVQTSQIDGAIQARRPNPTLRPPAPTTAPLLQLLTLLRPLVCSAAHVLRPAMAASLCGLLRVAQCAPVPGPLHAARAQVRWEAGRPRLSPRPRRQPCPCMSRLGGRAARPALSLPGPEAAHF